MHRLHNNQSVSQSGSISATKWQNNNIVLFPPLALFLEPFNSSAAIHFNLRFQSICIGFQPLLAWAALVLPSSAYALKARTAVRIAGARITRAAAALLTGAAVVFASGASADSIRWVAENASAVLSEQSLSALVPSLTQGIMHSKVPWRQCGRMLGGMVSLIKECSPFLKQLPMWLLQLSLLAGIALTAVKAAARMRTALMLSILARFGTDWLLIRMRLLNELSEWSN